MREQDSAVRLIQEVLNRALLRFREREQLSPCEGLKLGVGFSGGLDSSVLFDALVALAGALNLEIFCLHVDHGLREESAEDAQFVKARCEEKGIRFLLCRAPERVAGENMEAWARGVRYRFFEEAAREFGLRLVLTAHHEQDQAETLLFRLITGRLARDGRCIREYDAERRVLRPLIGVKKEALEAYAEARKLAYVEDVSNFNTDFSRNALRLYLIPQIASEYNPRLVSSLAETAARLSSDEEYLWAEAARCFSSSNFLLLSADLQRIVLALRWRVLLLKAVQDCGSEALCLGYRSLNRVLSHLEGHESEHWLMDLGAGFSCEYGPKEGVCFFRTGNRRVVKNEIDSSLVTRILPVPGEVSFPFWGQRPVRFEAKVLEHGDFQLKSLFDVARDSENGSLLGSVSFFDAEAIEHGVLVVRQRAEGDVVDVWKRGRRKLKKLLQEKRVPLFLRAAYPVLTLNEEIIWVPGISRSRHAGVNLEAKKIVQFSVSGVE